MQTDSQTDNEMNALIVAANEQGAEIVAVTQGARQALYDAWALFERGETDPETLGQALNIVDHHVAEMQRYIEMDAVAKQVMGEVLSKTVEQRDELLGEIEEVRSELEAAEEQIEELVDEGQIYEESMWAEARAETMETFDENFLFEASENADLLRSKLGRAADADEMERKAALVVQLKNELQEQFEAIDDKLTDEHWAERADAESDEGEDFDEEDSDDE